MAGLIREEYQPNARGVKRALQDREDWEKLMTNY